VGEGCVCVGMRRLAAASSSKPARACSWPPGPPGSLCTSLVKSAATAPLATEMKPSKKQPQVLENLNTASGMISSPSSNNFSSAADQQQECAERGAQKAVAWQLKLQVLSDKLAAADAQHEGNELAEDL